MKATEQHFPVKPLIMLYKVVLIFGTVLWDRGASGIWGIVICKLYVPLPQLTIFSPSKRIVFGIISLQNKLYQLL